MHDTIKVGMLISRFFPRQGGAEIQCRILSDELSRKNSRVFVLTQSLPGCPASEKIGSIPVHRIGSASDNRSGSLSYTTAGLKWLLSRMDSWDILHAHLASAPGVLAALASQMTGRPALLKIAGSRNTGDIGTSKALWYGRLKLLFLKHAMTRFVCPSTETRRELVENGFPEDRIRTIPNGVDTARFTPPSFHEKQELRRRLGLPEKDLIALYTGRLEPGKGLETLLSSWLAAQESRQLPPLSTLLIVGSGSLDASLRASAREHPSVRFPGWRERIDEYLRASDIFILPSLGEGMSNSLLEAMACGCACIATRIGGITDLVADGQTGALIEPGSEPGLRQAITALALSARERERLGSQARAEVAAKYSISRVADEYRALYKELILRSRYRK